jgi:hypothetical protein
MLVWLHDFLLVYFGSCALASMAGVAGGNMRSSAIVVGTLACGGLVGATFLTAGPHEAWTSMTAGIGGTAAAALTAVVVSKLRR